MNSICINIFVNNELLLHNARRVPEISQILLSTIMFDELGCLTRDEHVMLRILWNLFL